MQKKVPLIHFTDQQPYKELSWTLGAVIIYVFVFQVTYPILGEHTAPLAVLPTLVAGWLLGLWPGLIVGLIMNVLSVLLLSSKDPSTVYIWQLALPNGISIILAGLLTGWLKQLLLKVHKQSQQLVREQEIMGAEVIKRRRVEQALRRVQGELESRVEERTTELAETNAALRQSEISLRTILDNGSQAFALIDQTYRLCAVNRIFRQIVQDHFSKDVQMGTSIWECIQLEQRDKIQKNLDKAFSGRPAIFEENIKGPNEVEIWLEWTYTPVFDGRGRVTQICLAGVEITDRHQAEERIWQSAQRFQSLIENAADVVGIFDADGIFRYLSPSITRVLGYKPEQLIGAKFISFLHPDDVSLAQTAFIESTQISGAGVPVQVRVRNQEGAWRVMEGLIKNLLDSPTVNGIVITVRDVTERVEADKVLRAYTVQLEQSNRELQDFAFVASHDLQEPLRKVRAFGDRLQSKYSAVLDERGQDYVTRMQDAAARMQSLLQDLLTFSRVTTRARPFEWVDLDQINRAAVADLENTIKQTKGVVEIDHLPSIEADPSQMQQLMQNLISNGLKFHREGLSPLVKVTGQCIKNDDQMLPGSSVDDTLCQLTVEDNGIGFDEKYLDRIFQVFQRLHGRGEYDGTGIGLAVCRKIVERHNGVITAQSTLGQGAKFIITLPAKQTRPENQ